MCFQQSLTCYRRCLQTCTVFVWKNIEAQKLLPDVANLESTRNCRRYILFHCIFACFAKTCVFNKVFCVTKLSENWQKNCLIFLLSLVECYWRGLSCSKIRENVGKNRFFHGEERFFGKFFHRAFSAWKAILEIAQF